MIFFPLLLFNIRNKNLKIPTLYCSNSGNWSIQIQLVGKKGIVLDINMIVYMLHKVFFPLKIFISPFQEKLTIQLKAFFVSSKSIFTCEYWDGLLIEHLFSLEILCLIGDAYFVWEEKLEAEHFIFLFLKLRAGKFSESFRRCSLECTPFFVTHGVVFLGARRRNGKGGSGLVGIFHLSTRKLGSVLVWSWIYQVSTMLFLINELWKRCNFHSVKTMYFLVMLKLNLPNSCLSYCKLQNQKLIHAFILPFCFCLNYRWRPK